MIAAIYARKSTEQLVADEQKSVARQVEHARQYAQRKGWTIDEAYIYVDDGISGAEFARRPGFVRLMAALKPRPPFQILIMSEESRLGRESIETAYALKQIVVAGVRVFFYFEDRERTLNSPIEKVMLSLQTMTDEMERAKARQRAIDKARQLAAAGHVAGGKVFGYENLEVLDAGGRRSHVAYQINELEARVIRRIFELTVAGHGQRAIAKILNAEDAPSPRAQQGRPSAWGPSSVHEALHRQRYRGDVVWNQTRKCDQWGQLKRGSRDESEWLRVHKPELRIVPEELWQAAHAHIAARRDTTNVRRTTPPADSKYLLPGLARCAWCNGGMHVRKRTRSNGRHLHFYACTTHYDRGTCTNQLQVRMEDVDREVLERVGTILSSDLIEDVLARIRQLQAPSEQDSTRKRLERDVAAAEREVERYAAAIAIAGNIAAAARRLKEAEERRQRLAEELNGDRPSASGGITDWRLLERQARQRLGEWRALFGRDTAGSRQLLRELLEEPLRFTPIARGYHFEGAAAIGEIFSGIVQGKGIGV